VQAALFRIDTNTLPRLCLMKKEGRKVCWQVPVTKAKTTAQSNLKGNMTLQTC
jgi:hypothetical protein